MRIAMFFATGCVFAALAVACGSSDSGGGGGGAGGGAGAAGSAGSGGSGGGSSGDCSPPQCFMDLMAACMPTGACTKSGSGDITSGLVANSCYANGVKQSTTMTTGATGMTSHMTWYKSDGSTCFTADGATDSNGNHTEYKDTGGNTVVTVTVGMTGGATTYECGGQTFTVDPSKCSSDGGSDSCTAGDCTVP